MPHETLPQTSTGQAPDGRLLTISAHGVLDGDWFWSLRVTSPLASVGLTAGAAGYVDLRADDFPQLVEQITYRGRPLTQRIGGLVAEPRWFVGLGGVHHDLMLAGAGAPPRLADIVGLLDDLRPADGPDGLVLDPTADTELWGICGRRYVEGVGTVTVYPRAEAAGLIPGTPGKRVAHGHIWYTNAGFTPGTGGYFVHAGTSTVTLIRDERGVEADATDDAVAALLDSLELTWSEVRP